MTIDLILGVVIGTVFGFLIALLFNKLKGGTGSAQVKELKAEHEQYRKKVDDHFVNTAVLFKGLTDQYRDVYRHIATGAGELCSDEAKSIQIDMQETALLAHPADGVGADEVLAVDKPIEPEVKAQVDEQVADQEIKNEEEAVELENEVEMPAELVAELKNKAAQDK